MRPLESIVILVEPGASLDAKNPIAPTQRDFDEYDRFADELQSVMSARVVVHEGLLAEAPRDSLLLVAYHIGMRGMFETAWSRNHADKTGPILLNVEYKEAFDLAERAQVAGVVTSERFIRWVLRQDERATRQIYGLKSLASILAPEMRPSAMGETEHYCVYRSEGVLTLPKMLSLYVAAYWQSL